MKIDKKTIIALVLVVVAAVVVVRRLKDVVPSPTETIRNTISNAAPEGPGHASQASTADPEQAPKDEYEIIIAGVMEADLDYRDKDFRNPMEPLVSERIEGTAKSKPSGPATNVSVGPTDALKKGYTIEGIVWNEVEPLALVNGQVVAVGEQLNDGSIITEISADTVRFTHNAIEYYLVFRGEE